MTSLIKRSPPDPIAQQMSKQLLTLIKQKMTKSGGKITFADYMHLCLYAPGFGYYSAGNHKIGSGGDFTTAPEISSLFSQAFSNHIKDVMQQLPHCNIVEFGAGNGTMAIDILKALERSNSLPEQYIIIETSADFRQRQTSHIETEIPHLASLVHWFTAIPNSITGVIIANEVCDAMPVHLIKVSRDTIKERYVSINSNNELFWCDGDLSIHQLQTQAQAIQNNLINDLYISEINLYANAWITSLAEALQKGAIFIVDYGYSNEDYYRPDRHHGTLMCYHQHQGHENPLILPGLQDITAHVDFTSLAQSALDNGLDVASFQYQRDFLLAGDITNFVDGEASTFKQVQQKTEIKRLTLPAGMGETFKALTLTKNLDALLPRIQLRDQRHHL
jgi:SAM-dependent MidA family methyltransferase